MPRNDNEATYYTLPHKTKNEPMKSPKKLSNKSRQLRGDIDSFREANRKLTTELGKITKANKELIKENKELIKENKKLMEDNKRLTNVDD